MLEFIIAGLMLAGATQLTAGSKDTKSFNVHSAEGGWVQIAVAAIGALASARQSRDAARQQQGMTVEQIREQGAEQRRSAAYDAALADYYQQQGADRARKSLANFSRWSSLGPQQNPFYTPTAPTMPDANAFNAPTKPKK